ncbi:D-alanyl-D-alanine carboxypeptidase family protein [Desulfitobacterium sp. AusDCA]|uniref:D-alanyl-D-alanine carboxypeptidase family protein n=1 Tax=Desulfitobacterium sp. AusDCA TaxID=3240383 RepID=UPI003DA754B3
MKITAALIVAIFIFLNNVPPAYALASSAPPEIHGTGAYLIDVQSGQTLYSKNGDLQLQPASTTKIMTGLLAIENGKLDDVVTLSSTLLNYQIVYGTRIYLEPGEQMTLRNLLYALMLNSANDAAVGIAEYIGGDLPHFVSMMNEKAKSLGLKDTTFKNPSGLTDNGHVTTAHDLARIAQAAYANATFRDYIQTQRYTIPRSKPNVPTEMINENKLLGKDSYINGMKTGYTAAAQNCLVASASKDGRDLIGVILQSPGREIYTDMENLLDYGFTQFQTTEFKPSGSALSQLQIGKEQVNMLLEKPILTTHKLGEANTEPILKINSTSANLTQVNKGQVIGNVEVWDENEKLMDIPLVADRTISPTPVNQGLFKTSKWGSYLFLLGILFFLLFLKEKSGRANRRLRQARLKNEGSRIRESNNPDIS